ncbi:MAG: radical SAM protein [Lentisphaerae bacterium]|nr:radical SAM protein [Lentisphaerota bacterium]
MSASADDGYAACTLCPRQCGVDRRAGETGFCGAGAQAEVYAYNTHHGEEPPVSARRGSGTVFFSRCTLRCLYCQNYPWSLEAEGAVCTAEGLAEILGELAAAGCHNWNLVSPTPWLPSIREAVGLARARGRSLPLVYNTSGFERTETLERYGDLADVYLTDLRYARRASARAGSGFADYVPIARAALAWMWARTGPLRLDAEGAALSGTICRLLILPGRAEEVVENLEWIAEHIGTELPVGVMSQYTPAHRAPSTPGWDRPITRAEYRTVCRAVEALGFENGWVQGYGGETPAELVGFRMKRKG